MFGIGMKEVGIIVLVILVLFALNSVIPKASKKKAKPSSNNETDIQ